MFTVLDVSAADSRLQFIISSASQAASQIKSRTCSWNRSSCQTLQLSGERLLSLTPAQIKTQIPLRVRALKEKGGGGGVELEASPSRDADSPPSRSLKVALRCLGGGNKRKLILFQLIFRLPNAAPGMPGGSEG